MAIQRLSHVGICVSNLEKSIAFYRDVFDYQILSQIEIGPEADNLLDLKNTKLDVVYMQREGEDTRIELLYYRSPGYEKITKPRNVNLVGLTHLSFRTDDFDGVIEAVKKAGGNFLENSIVDHPAFKMKAGFVTDPDDMRIELLQAPGDPNALPG